MKTRISLLAALSALTFAGAASAADLPRRTGAVSPAPYQAQPAGTWTGFYAGLVGGYAWGSQKGAADGTYGSLDGAQIGVTGGYNMQWGQIVAGVEGDMSWSNADNKRAGNISELRNEATIRARAGVAVDNSTLLYATAGYAGASIKRDNGAAASTDWHNGYELGAGLEYAFTRNVTGKAEYLYTDLGNSSGAALKAGATQNGVRMGVNYRF
jgi:outer membrane immunogenic protein